MMNYLRSSVNLRAYGQRDPLIEYKKEGLILFKNLQENIYEQVINIIPNLATNVIDASSFTIVEPGFFTSETDTSIGVILEMKDDSDRISFSRDNEIFFNISNNKINWSSIFQINSY